MMRAIDPNNKRVDAVKPKSTNQNIITFMTRFDFFWGGVQLKVNLLKFLIIDIMK